MAGLRLGFETPAYLWLLLLVPLLWLWGYRSLRVLGRWRRFFALLLRSVVVTAIVLALAGIQLVRIGDRVTVMYLLDQSESVPQAKRQLMLDYVIREVRAHRNAARGDEAGILVFAREAAIEIPPFDDEIPPLRGLESYLGRTDATDLEGALKLAQAVMPEDTARRIVIVTDGNENVGNAMRLAGRLADAGIGIDVVPVPLDASSEVLVEKVDLPQNIRRGQPIDARVVVSNLTETDSPVSGRLIVTRSIGSQAQRMYDEPVQLQPGKNVFPLRHQIEQPAPYTYKAQFVPDSDDADAIAENNEATAYTYVRGKGRVLLIEDWQKTGEYELLVDRLRDADIETDVIPSNRLFTSLAELQAYDAVILAGVPRTSGGSLEDESTSPDSVSSFTDEQIEMLVRNTEQLGSGLLMIGGPEAFGAGGWAGTRLEEAMPVDFQIRNTKVQAVGALAMIMHASEMAQGNYWQKVIARSAIEAMGPADYCGVLHWDFSGDAWLWGGSQGMIEVGPNRRAMLAALSRMTPGDMPQFDPAMRMALAGLNRTPASLKHCIIISDGDPSDPSPRTIAAFQSASIKISTVAVATHGPAESRRLQSISRATGGKYYQVNNPKALPKIFQREARRVARPLVKDLPGGARPQVVYPHPVLDGIDRTLPPITGFVMTQTKDSPLAQVILRSPEPSSAENSTIMAVWTYKAGRTAVVTTDAGSRWASSWVDWPGYDKLWTQTVRWVMRPTGDTGKFDLATQVRDGEVQVVVSALDKDDEFLNFLDMSSSVLGPDLKPIPLRMRQTAPGRYVGSFPADDSGSYFINIVPQPGSAPLTSGITVPYSSEFRVREANRNLLESLAELKPRGGEPGAVTPPLEPGTMDQVLGLDTFRRGLALARNIRDAWPWFVLAGCLAFLGDVFVRRVALDFSWIGSALAQLRGREDAASAQSSERLERLRARKAEVGDELTKRRAATRFEPEASDADAELPDTGPASATAPRSAPTGKESMGKVETEELSYTERLMAAKRRARGEK